MFPSKREISRSNGRTEDNLSKRESPVQNGRIGKYVENTAPPKQDVMLKVSTENKVFYVSKRVLRGGTACNKGLK